MPNRPREWTAADLLAAIPATPVNDDAITRCTTSLYRSAAICTDARFARRAITIARSALKFDFSAWMTIADLDGRLTVQRVHHCSLRGGHCTWQTGDRMLDPLIATAFDSRRHAIAAGATNASTSCAATERAMQPSRGWHGLAIATLDERIDVGQSFAVYRDQTQTSFDAADGRRIILRGGPFGALDLIVGRPAISHQSLTQREREIATHYAAGLTYRTIAGRFDIAPLQILREADRKPLRSVARRHGLDRRTLRRWRMQYGRLSDQLAQRIRELERENRRLKALLAQREVTSHDGVSSSRRCDLRA